LHCLRAPALSACICRRAVLATRPGAPPEGTSTSSSAVQQETSFIEPAGVPGWSHPGRVLLQGHAALERSPEPAPPGGPSTSSSAVQQETSFIEAAGVPGWSHPGRVLLQGHAAQERSPEPAPPGGTSTSSSAVQQEIAFIEPAGVPGCSHPGRVLLQGHDAREGERIELTLSVPPGCSAPALRHPAPSTESPRRMYAPYLRRHIRSIQIRHPGNEINHPHIA